MRALAEHYRACRRRFSGERLLIVFDIDGTLLQCPPRTASDDGDFGLSSATPVPFPGALETLRWFQMQPNTDVALNSGRSEALRARTLKMMSSLGKNYKIHFDDELVAMNPYGVDQVARAKCEALQRFRDAGYRIVAMVDDQLENAEAMAECDVDGDTLYLLAHRLFAGTRRVAGTNRAPIVPGDGFKFDGLMAPEDVSKRVRLVCHHLETRSELLAFFRSSIEWGRIAVALDEEGTPNLVGRFPEGPLRLETALAGINTVLKSVSIQLHGGRQLVVEVLELLAWFGLTSSQVVFEVDQATDDAIEHLREFVPDICLQKTVVPSLYSGGADLSTWLHGMRSQGVRRLSVNWQNGEQNRVAGELLERGWEVDISGLDEADSFLRAILLLPTSVTTPLSLFDWHQLEPGMA
jgi:mRNA-degrading endonuclease RelE of RelBE toxin-antitoxin system